MKHLTRILVPTDFSETSDAALAYANGLATRLGASLHVMHVFDDIYGTSALTPEVYAPVSDDVRERTLRGVQAQLDERLRQPDNLPVRGTTEIRTGLTASAIVECAEEHEIDIIVMGTHGRGGLLHLLLGSVAERVVRVAPCPVLTVCAAQHSRDRTSSREELRPIAAAATL